jgi:hypothetical protein
MSQKEKLFSCDFIGCNKSFEYKSKLIRHSNVHTEEKLFSCEIKNCDIKFKDKTSLKRHLLTHSSNKNFKCIVENCKAQFKHKNNLSQHLKEYHCNEKKFVCTIDKCNSKFKTKSNLKKHINNLHLNIEPIKCSFLDCAYTSKTIGNLKRHIKQIHNEEKIFACNFSDCEFKCKDSYSLKRHIQSHSEDRPFICNFENCNYKSKQKDSLKKHVKSVHSNTKNKPQKKSENKTSNFFNELNLTYIREFTIKFPLKKSCRIDFFMVINDIIFLIENDERQHRKNLICDEIERMLNANKYLTNDYKNKKRIFIRYNPDLFYIGKRKVFKKNLSEKERILKISELIKSLVNIKDSLPDLSCYYCFYDVNEQGIPIIFENQNFDIEFKKICNCIY